MYILSLQFCNPFFVIFFLILKQKITKYESPQVFFKDSAWTPNYLQLEHLFFQNTSLHEIKTA